LRNKNSFISVTILTRWMLHPPQIQWSQRRFDRTWRQFWPF
jgi:hypothetical protein